MEKLIRLFIVDRNMRRDEFLKRAGLSNGYLTMPTKGDGLNPSLDILYRITDVFKIPASSFYEILETGDRYVIAEVENYSRRAFSRKDFSLCLYYCIYCVAGTNQYKMAMKADCPLQLINNILVPSKLDRKLRLSSVIGLLGFLDIKLSEYLSYLESGEYLKALELDVIKKNKFFSS